MCVCVFGQCTIFLTLWNEEIIIHLFAESSSAILP